MADLEAVDEAADDVLVEGLVNGSGVDRRVEEVWCGGQWGRSDVGEAEGSDETDDEAGHVKGDSAGGVAGEGGAGVRSANGIVGEFTESFLEGSEEFFLEGWVGADAETVVDMVGDSALEQWVEWVNFYEDGRVVEGWFEVKWKVDVGEGFVEDVVALLEAVDRAEDFDPFAGESMR